MYTTCVSFKLCGFKSCAFFGLEFLVACSWWLFFSAWVAQPEHPMGTKLRGHQLEVGAQIFHWELKLHCREWAAQRLFGDFPKIHIFGSRTLPFFCSIFPHYQFCVNEKMKFILGLSVEDLQLKSFDEWVTSWGKPKNGCKRRKVICSATQIREKYKLWNIHSMKSPGAASFLAVKQTVSVINPTQPWLNPTKACLCSEP